MRKFLPLLIVLLGVSSSFGIGHYPRPTPRPSATATASASATATATATSTPTATSTATATATSTATATATATATSTFTPTPTSTPTATPTASPTSTATATATSTPTPTPTATPTTIVYTKGVWSSVGTGNSVPPEITANKGVVGLGIQANWSEIEKTDGVYTWTVFDSRLANAKAAGFSSFVITATWSQFDTPKWLLDEIQADTPSEILLMLDPAEVHPTFCTELQIPVWWGTRWHTKRKAFIAAAGAHFTNDPTIKATFCSFFDHNSMDWNNLDTIATIHCGSRGIGGDHDVNMVQQWMDAGWTRARVLDKGKEIVDAAAAAFPKQNLKLPIGGMDLTLAKTSPDPLGGDANYTTMAREIMTYIGTRPYKNRVYISRNTASTHSPTKQELIDNPPSIPSERYIFQMVLDRVPLSGLQTVATVGYCLADCLTPCRQDGNELICPPRTLNDVMQDSLDVMTSYQPTFVEIWTQDAKIPAYYDMVRAATIKLGGHPRR